VRLVDAGNESTYGSGNEKQFDILVTSRPVYRRRRGNFDVSAVTTRVSRQFRQIYRLPCAPL
jgi:hypothetical protein